MNNTKAVAKRATFTMTIGTEGYKKLINQTLGSPERAKRFVSAITSAVVNNPALEECDAKSIVSAGFLGESLNLSPSPQLGHYYLVPFEDRKNDRKVAQFQLGYKGYIQLAIRSGQYKKLTVLSIKEGELECFDPLNEEIKVNLISDDDVREATPTAGYYAMFEYVNGFRKAIYWSKEKMEAHAVKYSQGYAADKRKGTAYTFWSKDFDGMAYKTMLRQLLSKWGILSTEMQAAFVSDMASIDENGTPDYCDNEPTENEIPIAQDEPEEEETLSMSDL